MEFRSPTTNYTFDGNLGADPPFGAAGALFLGR